MYKTKNIHELYEGVNTGIQKSPVKPGPDIINNKVLSLSLQHAICPVLLLYYRKIVGIFLYLFVSERTHYNTEFIQNKQRKSGHEHT